ncbi:hypothetical protein BGZ98_009422 [Dissophora globulifera]|nr:hypothetical protein BGZ98_009422 [Dissophora globulifera]
MPSSVAMISIQNIFEATLRAASDQADTCSTVQYASALTLAAADLALNDSDNMCRSTSSALSASYSSFASATPPPMLSSFPYPSFLSHFFSRHEPLPFYNFDINPNTSVFSLTFLTAFVLQIAGFYLFRHFVPRLTEPDTKSRRGLSWVLTLFSSIVLFTGTFALSSNIEWVPFYSAASTPVAGEVGYGRTPTFLSLRNFPNESDAATMYTAYFVSYLICDLLMGMIYYRAYLDPLSGWTHHLGYIAVMSNVTLQKNVSTLFAMGAPIEVSTIFLASGHIFPKLRSDFLFATSFFISRIVYPTILLPEVYLNVESRMCWKVCLMALTLHVHWFHNADSEEKVKELPTVPTPAEAITDMSMREDITKVHSVIYEHPAQVKAIAALTAPTAITAAVSTNVNNEPSGNDMSDMDEAMANSAEVNGSRRRSKPKADRRRTRPSSDHSIDGLCDDDESDEFSDISPAITTSVTTATSTSSMPVTTTTTTTTKSGEAPVKTMKQLLEECDQEDFSYQLLPPSNKGAGGTNKTFSAAALRRLMQQTENSQTEDGNPAGVVRLSRASSMRDSKRRIALDAVRFEDPKASQQHQQEQQHKVKPRPKSVMFDYHREQHHNQHPLELSDGDATAVLRVRPLRPSVASSSMTTEVQGPDHDFGTVRMPRGVAVQA